MIIDNEIIKDGISAAVIQTLISRHETERDRYVTLSKYYLGEHEILHRLKDNDTAANNRIVINFAKYITSVITAYFVGSPVTYSTSKDVNIEPIKDCYFDQAIANLDISLEKQASICGRSVEMLYVNDDTQPRSCQLPAANAFIVYDDTVEHKKLFGVYYYQQIRLDGTMGNTIAIVADAKNWYYFRGEHSYTSMRFESQERHYFDSVPFIEYLNNEEQQGDFEQQISLINAYNTLMSDRVNDKEQFVDALLLLLGIDIDSDQAKKLKRERVLLGDIDGRGEYLSKNLNEADTDILRKALKEDIHGSAMVPDMTAENFAANDSGVAIKYKLLVFEQLVSGKERMFEKSLKERFSMYNNFFIFKGSMQKVNLNDVDIEFHRNLPANHLEISEIVSNLQGLVSDETLLSQIPFVTDAKEEAELAQLDRQRKNTEAMSAMGDYFANEPINTSANEK